MFNKSKKNNQNKNSKMPAINMISEDTRIEGSLHSDTDIRISGFVDGHIYTKGKLMLTPKGRVSGDIHAIKADVSGRIEGEVYTEEQLILRNGSLIKGDLFTKSLLVEEGAQFDGVCSMSSTNDKSKIKSKKQLQNGQIDSDEDQEEKQATKKTEKEKKQ